MAEINQNNTTKLFSNAIKKIEEKSIPKKYCRIASIRGVLKFIDIRKYKI